MMKIWKKTLIMLLAILGLSIGAAAVYLSTAYNFSTNELSKTFKDYGTNTTKSHAIEQKKPFSILLMGVDTGSNERKSKWEGNSDSMILVTINPETKETTMTSLERDILIKLSGPKSNDMTGVEAKLNAAYAAGGTKMAMMTIQDLLDIKIDNYMQINMQGLVDLVDAVGGITVTNKFDFPISIEEHEPEYTATVQPGTHKVNGEQALVYSRMRYDDPEGDYGRQKRQREVITKVVKKVLALDSVASYKKILSAISNNMQTDIEISSKTIPSLLGYADAVKNIKSYQLKGEDATLDSGSYQIVTSEHLLTVQNRIKKQLGLKTSSHIKTTAVLYEKLYGENGFSSDNSSVAYSTNDSTVVGSQDYSSYTIPTYTDTTVASSGASSSYTVDTTTTSQTVTTDTTTTSETVSGS